MIYSIGDLYDPASPFSGNGIDPLDWRTRLPDLSVFNFGADPGLLEDLWNGQVDQLAFRNVASALRLTIGRVAIAQGFTLSQMGGVRAIFSDPLELLATGLDTAKDVLGSKAFSKAVDAIGWIPIVGWVIEIITSVVELVISIVARIRDKKLSEARRALAELGGVPIGQWTPGADEALTRTMMLKIGEHDSQYIVSPRYPARSKADFRARRQLVNPGDEYAAAWLVYTESPDVEGSRGLGFVPGTRHLHAGMELRTRGARDFRDLGSFFPTARLAAVQWWEMMLAGGPSMFSVDADMARAAWADYLRASFDFAYEVLSGWSVSITAPEMGSTTEWCVPELYGVGQCKKSKVGELVPIAGNGHRSVYLEYLFDLFDPRRVDLGKGWERSNIDWNDTIPGRALQNLKDRQHAMLQSLACMTVDDSEVDGKPRFRAIGTRQKKGPLWSRWEQSVQAVFQGGDWRRVRFDDVPEGQLKDELRERCEREGIDCRDLGKHHETYLASPSVLGDPVPPTPPKPHEVRRPPRHIGRRPGRDKAKGHQSNRARRRDPTVIALALGALGGGLYYFGRNDENGQEPGGGE